MDTGAIYSDFGHLASLKADAQKNPNAALEDVAEQFESLFLQMMMKSMRDATVKGDLFSSNQMDTYMSMADKQIAVSLSENGGIGIARMLVEQMQTKGYVPRSVENNETTLKPLVSVRTANTVSNVTNERVFSLDGHQEAKVFEFSTAESPTDRQEG